jgi:hypothetical protein
MLLGDWYANILFRKPQLLVICISECTLLPVVVTAKDIHTLPERLGIAVYEVLIALGVTPQLADQERTQIQSLQFGRTNNKCITAQPEAVDKSPQQQLRDRTGKQIDQTR